MARLHAILLVISVVLLCFAFQYPSLLVKEHIVVSDTDLAATSESGARYLTYYKPAIERASRFYADQYPKGMQIFLADPDDIYEPYTRSFLRGSGGYAVYTRNRAIVINTSNSAALFSYSPGDRRIFSYLDDTLVHEIAHQWDFKEGTHQGRTAMFYNDIGWKRGFPSFLSYSVIDKNDQKQSAYGLTNPSEDIAETVSNMYVNPSLLDEKRKEWFSAAFSLSDNSVGLGFPVPKNVRYEGYLVQQSSANSFRFSYREKVAAAKLESRVLSDYELLCKQNVKNFTQGYRILCDGKTLTIRFVSDNFFVSISQ